MTEQKLVYLPPGTLTNAKLEARQEGLRTGRIQAALVVAAVFIAAGIIANFISPKELSAGVNATIVPAEGPADAMGPRIPVPPCNDIREKGCMRIADATGQGTRYLPEPGALLLVAPFAGWLVFKSRKV